MTRATTRHVDATKAPSGLDLKVARVAARVRQYHIAAQMGVTVSRVSAIEREEFPSAEIVRRYRAALGACQNVLHAPKVA